MSNLTTASPAAAAPNAAKKKRNLPGNPDPDAEVIALSPKSLMATNRFMCEVCNKGFQRDQNLQLHRRGHNLPWKLKQRSTSTSKDVAVRKKKPVYVCPEASCVHHSPARALGDLTGIKKHFSRKHGEKKYKCDRCSKKYAVHSDWKAHSKTCGTREYTCDCGTIFSRRDSFITHRAFCDALAEENSKANIPPHSNPSSSTVFLPKGTTTSLEQQQQHFNNAWLPTISIDHTTSSLYSSVVVLDHLDTAAAAAAAPHENTTTSLPDLHPLANSNYQANNSPAHLSATALLQKAAQMGATMSRPGQIMMAPHSTSPAGIGSFAKTPLLHQPMPMPISDFMTRRNGEGGGNGLTRDFLGPRALSHKDMLSMAAAGLPCMTSSSSSSSSSFHH